MLSRSVIESFSDELVKLSALTLKGLAGAASRIRRSNFSSVVPKGLHPLDGFTIPTRLQQKSPNFEALSKFQESFLPKEFLEAVGPELAKQPPGRIFVTPNLPKTIHPGANPTLAKNLDNFTVVHEGLERANNVIGEGSLHSGPRVLVQDKNLRNQLVGPGASSLRNSMDELRGAEDTILKRQFVDSFKDRRALDFLNKGKRVPKAMQKAFVRSNPKMSINDAHYVMQQQGSVVQDRAIKSMLGSGATKAGKSALRNK